MLLQILLHICLIKDVYGKSGRLCQTEQYFEQVIVLFSGTITYEEFLHMMLGKKSSILKK